MPEALTVQEAVINQIASDTYATATDKGFWNVQDPFLAEINTKLMLIVSEVAEAMEVLRRDYGGPVQSYTRMTELQQEDFTEEVIDVIIRAFDLARHFTDTPGEVMLAKMAHNTTRPKGHGKRF